MADQFAERLVLWLHFLGGIVSSTTALTIFFLLPRNLAWGILAGYAVLVWFQHRHRTPLWNPVLRRLRIWKRIANYFPAQLVKSAELDPNKNYIFAYHPHGMLSTGAWLGFATEGLGFSAKFPGIIMHVLTLTINFKVPFLREYLLGLGVSDVSRDTCRWLLTRKVGEQAILLTAASGKAKSLLPDTKLQLHVIAVPAVGDEVLASTMLAVPRNRYCSLPDYTGVSVSGLDDGRVASPAPENLLLLVVDVTAVDYVDLVSDRRWVYAAPDRSAPRWTKVEVNP
ncbi:hypothetical protein WJX72_010009 [[Myrmecia] bisecta]|uniref:diacylglycerol O-acyltransferase n=1 Tax=[Myrmecia] bisecta TaxID=41462 RepID=A0AAW1R9C2_9CHLO